VSRELLFYSDFPFGYHNPEAEERMRRFASRGYEVHYVEQLGIRNPRPRHLLRVLSMLRRPRQQVDVPFEVISPKLLAPRHVWPTDQLNRRWLTRQLLRHLRTPGEAILWIRYPTPELVPLVEETRVALVIYECVDDHEASPGITARLRRVMRAAERRILARADLVLASSEPVRSRLADLHANVLRIPAAAVDMEAFEVPPLAEAAPSLALYTGHADFRFDCELVAAVAGEMPDWTFVITGPVTRQVRRRLAPLPNVDLAGQCPPREIPGLLASTRVCLLPYRLGSFTDSLFPVKLVEYLAAGRPVVGVPMHALREFGAVVRTAASPADFAGAIRKAAADDSAGARSRRREAARPFDWNRQIEGMDRAIREALADA
jgi:glycosyltransferase involved in cell wall biosynthesis